MNKRWAIAGILAAAAATSSIVATGWPSSSPAPAKGAAAGAALGVPSAEYWAHQLTDSESDSPLGPSLSTVYEGNTDQTFLTLTQQAAALPRTGGSWKNAGPFGGVADIPGTGSGNEGFGPVDGIGTAIAVDPSDRSGNTAYLGTIGGLYKTTNGGATMTNVVDGALSRVSIGAIAVDPTNPKIVYAGTGVSIFTLSDDAAGTGVYVSRNGGASWSRPAQNTHGYGVNSIAVSPNGTVYVGTTYGLWRSTNHGRSFSQVPLPDNQTHTGPAAHPLGSWVTAVAIDPANPNEVTAAVGYAFGQMKYPDGEIIAPGNGLYRSTDNGAHFSFLPSTSQLTWQGASSDPVGRTSLAYSTAPGGKGILWALVADAGKAAGAHSCVDTPAIPVCADGNSELNGLYRSSDDGATWHLASNSQMLGTALGASTSGVGAAIDYAAGVQAIYNNWVVADPQDPNRVYIGLEEALTGEYHDPTGILPVPSMTWTAVEKYANLCGFLTYYNTIPNSNGAACPSQIPVYGSGTTHPDQHSAAFAATPTGFRLYSGNDGGWWSQDAHSVTDSTGVAYQGYDNGDWKSLGLPATVLPWDVARLQDGSYLLALQDNGVAHVRPNGTAYQVCGGDGVYVFPGANAQSYYCGIDGQQILATTDDMAHTINVTPTNNQTGQTFLSPWTVDSTNSNHLLAAAGNVDETTDGPNTNTYDPTDETLLSSTWQTVYTPPAAPNGKWDSSAVYTQGPVSYVAFCSPCRPSLATGSAANPAVVTDGIATNVIPGCKAAELSSECWHMEAGRGLPHEQISGFAVDPTNPSTVYVSLRQLIVMGADPKATGNQKVMVSHDGGATFTDLTGNLPRADAHRIALRDGRLYVATDVGVFTAPAGSTRWATLGTGKTPATQLPQVTYRSMKLDPTGRYLVAGAYGRGGWVYDFGKASAPKKVTMASVAPVAAPSPVASATSPAAAAPASRLGSTGTGASARASTPGRYSLAGHPGRSATPLVLIAVIGAVAVVGFGTWGGRRLRRRAKA